MPPSKSAPAGPFQDFNFLVEIDGVTVAGFSEVSGLSSETAIIEYREGSDKRNSARKLPGLTKFSNIVLKRGITTDLVLWNWRKAIVNGVADRRSGAIILLNSEHQPMLRVKFVRGWPSKWEGPVLNAKGNEIAIETLEIAHEGLDLDT